MPLPLSGYFGATPIDVATVRADLWTAGAGAADYAGEKAAYQATILEQYRIYVEMFDRVSARRALANGFFLSLNTATLTAAGALWQATDVSPSLLLLLLALMLVQNAAWFWLVRSYRQLNTAKGAVIGMLEERLPASPFWLAEWKALGEGKDKARYWPLSHLEQWLPATLATLAALAFVLVVAGPR